MNKEDLEAIALLGGAVAFVAALWQYRIAQRWKRAEWIAAEMRAFLDDPWVRVTCTLIDWGARKVRLPPDAEVEALVTDDPPGDSVASVPADTTDEIPVPAPTPKLGDIVNPGLDPARDTTTAGTDSVGATPELPKPAVQVTPPAAPARVPPPTATTPPPGCWRVQILAPKEKAEANRKRSAAESILLVPMVIERDGGLYKIRTRECFTRATADIVRGRAVASGFAGAFPFEGAKR